MLRRPARGRNRNVRILPSPGPDQIDAMMARVVLEAAAPAIRAAERERAAATLRNLRGQVQEWHEAVTETGTEDEVSCFAAVLIEIDALLEDPQPAQGGT